MFSWTQQKLTEAEEWVGSLCSCLHLQQRTEPFVTLETTNKGSVQSYKQSLSALSEVSGAKWWGGVFCYSTALSLGYCEVRQVTPAGRKSCLAFDGQSWLHMCLLVFCIPRCHCWQSRVRRQCLNLWPTPGTVQPLCCVAILHVLSRSVISEPVPLLLWRNHNNLGVLPGFPKVTYVFLLAYV